MSFINEDNTSGFHTGTVHTGVHRSVTGGNDAPVDVGLPKLKQSVKKAKDILMGKDGGNGGSSVSTDSHDVYNIDNSVHVDNSVHHSGVADGLAWFGTHFKEIAIVAAASAAILAIAKLIKGANKSIKLRYNKVVKSLQKAQKDFTLAPDGMNMKSILPGIGSRLNDWITRTFSGNLKSRKGWKRQTAGNIGLHPFCQQYIDEIEADYRVATAAFSKIKLGADSLDSKEAGRNTDSSVGGASSNVSTSAYSGKIYSSFREAYSNELLNEGVSKDKLDESILATISAGVALTSLAVKAGTFLYQRFKNGKPEGDPKAIQVTAESTREICYAIINNYADKYVNMNQVFNELGIDSKSLADLDKSSVDKLRTILEKYEKPEKNAYTKQYSRINEAYKKMLNHYYKIGDGIIENFVKYSEASDEKHSNLIVASKEKLKNMWDSQKDFYENNFSHVIVEIVASEAYINYLDFIINKVLPVFKSGLAGDADYIFDVVPKKGEYYIIRQTGDQPVIDGTSELKGKSGIAEVIGFDKNTKNITFKFVGALNDSNGYTVSDEGIATLDNSDKPLIDYDVYKDKGDIELEYGKWLSVDPIQLKWNPEKISTIYYKHIDVNEDNKNCTQFVYSKTTYEAADKGYNKFYLVTTKRSDYDVINFTEIDYDGLMKSDDFERMCERELDMYSTWEDEDHINYWNSLIDKNENKKDAGTIDEVAEIIKNTPERKDLDKDNDEDETKPEVHAVSKLYKRTIKTDRGREIEEYAYAVIEESDESFKSCSKEMLNENGTLDEGLFRRKKKKDNEESSDDSEKTDSDSSDDEENRDENTDANAEDNDNLDEPSGEGTPVVEPGTDAASKSVVRMIICGNIDKASGKSIMDDIKDNKFDGSSITIDPACSIDDVDKEFERLGFETVEENANKIKGKLLQSVMQQSGKVRKTNVGAFRIDDVESALKEIENREGAYEKINADADKIAEGIIEKIKGVLTGSPKDMFGRRKLTDPNNPTESIKLKGKAWNIFLMKKPFSEQPYVEYDTEANDDNTGKQFTLYLYPTIITEAGAKTKSVLEGKPKYGVIIYLNKDINEVVPLDKSEIESAVKNMFNALAEGGKIEPSRFDPLETKSSDEENQSEDEDKIDTKGLSPEDLKLAESINSIFDVVSVIETEGGSYKFHDNGKKPSNIEVNSSEGDYDFISVTLKDWKLTGLTLKFKDGKIEVQTAIGVKNSEIAELKTWTRKELFSVVGKLLHSISDENKNDNKEEGSIDTSKMNDIQKKLVADIEDLLKIVKVEKADDGRVWFDVNSSKKSGNVEIVTNDGKTLTFTAHFNGVGNLIVLGNCSGNSVTINSRYNGENGQASQLKDWSVKSIYDVLSTRFGEDQNKTEDQNKKSDESVNITYKTKTSVSESTNISTTNIKRKISGRFKNWYVLSEAVYDDGSGYKSKLDNNRVIESMTERSDFSKFAKTSKFAKFMPFESIHEYTLVSDNGYTPSVATPLYESVVLVKFDKMDNVIDKIVVGKFKID